MSVVLVCGSRNWEDKDMIRRDLTRLRSQMLDLTLHHGGCRGADRLAAEVATELGIPAVEWKADWERYGRMAGPIRNRQMIDARPDIVIAYGRGKGTDGTCLLASARGIPLERREGPYGI